MLLQCLPSGLDSLIMIWEELLFEEFQDGHRGATVAAILNIGMEQF